ncbi:MAG: hypothetical protein HYZ53_15465 [Planctomycetes bacterium]|nr:hypothetical protein [Planctomycetota bacterium]
MGNLYLWLGLTGLVVYLLDLFRVPGRLLGSTELRLAQVAHSGYAAVARADRRLRGGPPSAWELTKGCRLHIDEGHGGFGTALIAGCDAGTEAGREFEVVGSRWASQRVADKGTAQWREFALARGEETWLLVALKFMNKLVLMRRIGPGEFAPGLSSEADVERFVLRLNRAGLTLEGGPDAEALTVGRVGPIRYANEDWPAPHGGANGAAESFLAGSTDKSRHLLARKERGRLRLWYGRVVDERAILVRLPAEAGA